MSPEQEREHVEVTVDGLYFERGLIEVHREHLIDLLLEERAAVRAAVRVEYEAKVKVLEARVAELEDLVEHWRARFDAEREDRFAVLADLQEAKDRT